MKKLNVKTVAGLGQLKDICNTLGASYNPSKASIKPTAINTLLQQAQQTVEAVNSARINFILANSARKESFAGIPTLAARVVRAVSASDASQETIGAAKLIKGQLYPRRKSPMSEVPAEGTESKVLKRKKQPDLKCARKMETLSNLIKLVEGIASYKPNEADLKVAALKATLADLQAKSQSVSTKRLELENIAIVSNQLLSGPGGIKETMASAKDYIRSLNGFKSEKTKQIGKIELQA
jgi:hypothetical protein